MPLKDYYAILKISPTTSVRGIRDAYRGLAKTMHPDRVGETGTKAFQDVVEAYEVLSDPEKRRRYHRELDLRRSSEVLERTPGVGPEPVVLEPLSLRATAPAVHPSFEELAEHLFRNLAGLPKTRRMEGLNLEVVLSPREAAAGAVLTVGVPVFRPCPVCDGSGRDWFVPCATCRQQGVVEHEEPVTIRIPAMVRNGTVVEASLNGLGIHNLFLRVLVTVA